MADLRNLPKQFLSEFIEMYKSHPCLWKIKSSDYCNRDLRIRAYKSLVNKLKEVDEEATKDLVVRKIDSLRGSFRKELKKVKESERSGAGMKEVYQPRLWYFEKLLFLTDQELPRQRTSNVTEFSSHERISPTVNCFDNSDDDIKLCEPCMPSQPQVSTKKDNMSTKKDNSVQTVELQQVEKEVESENDEFETVGKHVANKLRKLPRETAVLAEKLIMDVLFEAQWGTLTRASKLVLRE